MNSLKYGMVVDGAEHQVAFYLCDQFSMLPFISAIETLRIANRRANKPLYQWRTITSDGQPVTASNGMPQPADYAVESAPDFPMVFVCGPFEPRAFNHGPSFSWLKHQARQGALIGGIETGCHIVAKAGLLAGLTCTIHWENMKDFKQDFPQLSVSADVYEIEGNRISCSGGCASIDIMLYLIEQQHGHELAASIADSMIHPHIRAQNEPQRMGLQARIGTSHPALLECVELMEANIEEPLTPDELAALIQVSKRQMERLFQRHLKTTPNRYYLGLRLDAAHQLLQDSSLKIVEAALACGFKSSVHFSTCYQSRYGSTPREGRK
jgi:transcriptional regulator GlxA family with amidase domain